MIRKATILGCGGSAGVPQVGCECFVCHSDNHKNHRSRSSILIESYSTKILVDTSPDFRQQALDNKLTNIDAVIYTHPHYDHIAGIDELRHLLNTQAIPTYANSDTTDYLLRTREYIFEQAHHFYPPILALHKLNYNSSALIGDIKVQSFPQWHGTCYTMGLRFDNDIAYSTDVCEIEEEVLQSLRGIKIWVVGCTRYLPSLTHAHVEKVLEWVAVVQPQLTILTHMNHDIEYDEISALLPATVRPAFDGMVLAL